jgi:hypothetical protein
MSRSKIKIKKIQNFTLLEVMISLFIVAILLSVVFRFFFALNTSEKKMQTTKHYVLKKHHLRVKLNDVFSKIVYKSFSKEPFFYTANNALNFKFDNGIDPDPNFSSNIEAKLYIDKQDNLILKTMPLEQQKTYREEILMENVNSLSFEFLYNLHPKSSSQKIFYDVVSKWDKKKETLPSSIRIKLKTQDDDNLTFTFFISKAESSIIYYEKTI